MFICLWPSVDVHFDQKVVAQFLSFCVAVKHFTSSETINCEILNILSVCLYSCLSYPTCNSRLVYVVVCGLLVSTIFLHIISKCGTILGKELLNIKCVLFPLQLLSETFLILGRIREILS